MNRLKQFCELFLLSQSFSLWPKVFYFYFVYTRTIFPLGVLYPGHSQLAFDCVIMACSSESIRPGLLFRVARPPKVWVRPLRSATSPAIFSKFACPCNQRIRGHGVRVNHTHELGGLTNPEPGDLL